MVGRFAAAGKRPRSVWKPASGVNDIANRGNSLDQYYFQPSRGFQFTVKARF